MSSEATLYQSGESLDLTPDAAMIAGEVVQYPDGRCAVSPIARDASVKSAVRLKGVFIMPKAATHSFLPGGRVYWDASANVAFFRKVNDADFYCGRVVFDAAETDTTVYVAINIDPPYDVDALRDGALSVATGTQAIGGFTTPLKYGGSLGMQLTATNEAQAVDILTVDRFAVTANPIVEAIVRVAVNGSGAAVDFNIGLANGTSTTDADAVTEHVFIHTDGSDLKLYAQSKDGTTTVAATDTTKVFVAGSAVANRFEVWIDARVTTDVKIYIDGVRVLSATAFKLNAAAGPLGLLAHLEKSTGTTVAGPVYIDALRAHLSIQ